VAGGTLGYNFQTGLWVWGVEGDFDFSTMKGSADCAPGTCETKNDWLGTARGRIGYAGWNNWLPYLTAGAALGDIKATSPIGSANKMKVGWTAGLGVEYALWTNWSVKAEYLYVDLGKFDCGVSCSGVGTDNVSFKANLARVGLNYRF
jgi:outer membrane immunogenic protein